MAKQIKSNEIFEDDIFKNIRESAERTIETMEKINAEFKNTGKALKESIGGAKFDSTKSINEFVKATQQANKLKADAIKLEKALADAQKQKAMADAARLKADQQGIKTKREQIKLESDLARETERAAKANEKAAKAARDEASAYKQLEKNTRELKNESKELAAQMLKLEASGQKNSKEYRQLASQYKDVTNAAKAGDAALKKIDSTVGDNFRNVGNYNGAIGKLKAGLGELGLAFGIGSIVTNAGQKIVEFDQKIADLVSITGASGDDLKFFKEQAIDLGKTVQGGAGEVIEAYKLIGSAKPELLENAKSLDAVTQSAITLSQASGMTLPEAATALTDAMNQFGADASQANYFIDALANGALAGSAEIPQVTEALLKFGAVAKTSNVQLDESVGLIEALAEKGLKGSEAGTALRNVMLKLSAPDALPKEAQEMLSKLGIDMEAMADPSKTFSERLEVIKPLLKDNAAMVKVFGTENVVAATNLISSTERIDQLTKAMNEQGTASDQAKTRNQTLSFAINQLKESWNALWLELSSGEGTSKILVDGLSFIARNLGTIVKWVAKVAAYWLTYQAAVKTANAVNFVMNGGLKDLGKSMLDVFKAQKNVGDGALQMGEKTSKAGKAMAAVPWMAIIGVVVELGMALYNMASGADDAARAQEGLNKAIEDGIQFGGELNKIIDEKYTTEKRRLDLLKSQGKLTEQQYKRELELAKKSRLSRINVEIQFENEEKARAKRTLDGLKTYYEAALDTLEIFRSREQISVIARYEAAQEEIRQSNEVLKLLYQQKKSIEDAAVDEQIEKNTEQRSRNTDAIKTQTQKLKELNTEFDKQNEYLNRQLELLHELDQIQINREIQGLDEQIAGEVATQTQTVGETGQFNTSRVAELIAKRTELEKKAVDDRLAYEIAAIEERYRIETEAAREALKANRDKLLSQEGLTPEKRAEIERNYQAELEKLEMDEVQRYADKELEKKILTETASDERVEIEKKSAEEMDDISKDLIGKYEEYADKQTEIDKKKAEEIADIEKKNAERRIEYFKLVTDYFIKRSNERIAQYDKEISKAEEQYDMLKQMAINGNIDAKESLAEQQRIINEANLKKEKEQKRQQRLQLLNTAFSTYNQKVADGSKNPLAETIRDIGLLRAFIETIPAFESGTEDTGTNGRGVDGRGGFHAILHPNERVVPKSLNEKIGDLSNEQLARIAHDYQNGKMIGGTDHVGSALDVAILVNKIDELNETIRNKPETNIELAEIVHGSIEIVKTIKKGNTTTYNRYKVKP